MGVPVTVTDSRGEFVGGLARRNFRLRVDGVERPIDYFAAGEEPAEALLLLETGPAVYLLGREHVLAATKLIEGLAPGDRVAISTYSDALSPLLAFTRTSGRPSRRFAAQIFGWAWRSSIFTTASARRSIGLLR